MHRNTAQISQISGMIFKQNCFFLYVCVDEKIVNIRENVVNARDSERNSFVSMTRLRCKKMTPKKNFIFTITMRFFVTVAKQTMCCRLSFMEMKRCPSCQQQTVEPELRKRAGSKTTQLFTPGHLVVCWVQRD